MRDVDREHGRARGEVLFLVDLEVFRFQRDVVCVAAHRVADGADSVDRRRAVSEFVGARLGKELATRSGPRNRVVAGSGLGQGRENLFERGPPDLTFSRGGQGELAVAFFDDFVLLERPAEFVEIDRGVDHSALLEVFHPGQRLLDVAARLEHELQEELRELLEGQERAEKVDGKFAVPVPHRGRDCTAARRAAPARIQRRDFWRSSSMRW